MSSYLKSGKKKGTLLEEKGTRYARFISDFIQEEAALKATAKALVGPR